VRRAWGRGQVWRVQGMLATAGGSWRQRGALAVPKRTGPRRSRPGRPAGLGSPSPSPLALPPRPLPPRPLPGPPEVECDTVHHHQPGAPACLCQDVAQHVGQRQLLNVVVHAQVGDAGQDGLHSEGASLRQEAAVAARAGGGRAQRPAAPGAGAPRDGPARRRRARTCSCASALPLAAAAAAALATAAPAMSTTLSITKLPSVSMYTTLPPGPPSAAGTCAEGARLGGARLAGRQQPPASRCAAGCSCLPARPPAPPAR
jgi:hypothetical protein